MRVASAQHLHLLDQHLDLLRHQRHLPRTLRSPAPAIDQGATLSSRILDGDILRI